MGDLDVSTRAKIDEEVKAELIAEREDKAELGADEAALSAPLEQEEVERAGEKKVSAASQPSLLWKLAKGVALAAVLRAAFILAAEGLHRWSTPRPPEEEEQRQQSDDQQPWRSRPRHGD